MVCREFGGFAIQSLLSALVVFSDAVVDQLQALKLAVEELRREVRDLVAENLVLRQENANLRQMVRDLTREVGYWKSRHADVKNKNVLVQAELDQAYAEIRQLKAERFGKTSEKQKKVDRSNDLAAPQNPIDRKELGTQRKKRGQQPERRAPKRRALSHLPVRVDDPRIPMDNNAAERKIRNPAVGRKNYYGSGAEWAGRRSIGDDVVLDLCHAGDLEDQS